MLIRQEPSEFQPNSYNPIGDEYVPTRLDTSLSAESDAERRGVESYVHPFRARSTRHIKFLGNWSSCIHPDKVGDKVVEAALVCSTLKLETELRAATWRLERGVVEFHIRACRVRFRSANEGGFESSFGTTTVEKRLYKQRPKSGVDKQVDESGCQIFAG
jgi:hypothetical protein